MAELTCLHGQHVRHRPPFQDREWVLSATGRKAHVGAAMDCPLCDRSEIPAGLVTARTLGPFDESTVPAALQRNHRLPPYTWGVVRVTAGSCRIRIETDPPTTRQLAPGEQQAIPPEVAHAALLEGEVILVIELLRGAH